VVLSAVNLSSVILWVVIPCDVVFTDVSEECLASYLEDRGDSFRQSLGNHLQEFIARRYYSVSVSTSSLP
jgi:hypothetical protein